MNKENNSHKSNMKFGSHFVGSGTDSKLVLTQKKKRKATHKSNITISSPKNERILIAWDIATIHKRLVKQYFQTSFEVLQLVLRICDISNVSFNGDNAHYFYELNIPHHQKSWTIKGVKPNRLYCVELGVRVLNSKFFPICQSNPFYFPLGNEKINSLNQSNTSTKEENVLPEWVASYSTYSLIEGKNGWEKQGI